MGNLGPGRTGAIFFLFCNKSANRQRKINATPVSKTSQFFCRLSKFHQSSKKLKCWIQLRTVAKITLFSQSKLARMVAYICQSAKFQLKTGWCDVTTAKIRNLQNFFQLFPHLKLEMFQTNKAGSSATQALTELKILTVENEDHDDIKLSVWWFIFLLQ